MKKLLLLLGLSLLGACASSPPVNENPLSGTHWQLVDIQSMDDSVVTPEAQSTYALHFGDDGNISIQADCNRMNGTYQYNAPSGLSFGPMAVTLALCPPGSLFDRFNKDMPYVRSFMIKDGRLFLSLMADGGIYQFAPIIR